jgi:GMP synthase (glutamine-hydrolysing)
LTTPHKASHAHQTVLILDFGSQFTQLIARRLRENRVYCEIHRPDLDLDAVAAKEPIGVILSGGPQSVYDDHAPQPDPGLFDWLREHDVPVLGICYGMQLLALSAGGSVEKASRREYGRAEVEVRGGQLFEGADPTETVWMSHGDHVARAPEGYRVTARTPNAPVVAFEHESDRAYGIQFHPEVSHTVHGGDLLRRFLFDVCDADGDWRMASVLEESVAAIRQRVGDGRVLVALSGGVDSSVMATLVHQAVGERMRAVFVDNGVLRKNERDQVMTSLRAGLGLPILAVDARERFLGELAGVSDPETKRKVIGRVFIEVFEEEARRLGRELGDFGFLAQGTLYPDVIESMAVRGPSAVIKTHHNVGGLPERLGFELVEPLRNLFKDEVRQLGRELGLPEDLLMRHPFPGPGLAVRILGEVTAERVAVLQEADDIFLHELRESGWYEKTSQAFAVLLPVKAVGVMGDHRTYESVVVLRAVETQDFMTADWSPLPHDLLGRAANRIVNEVERVNRVAYDVTSKPPGTIEWE